MISVLLVDPASENPHSIRELLSAPGTNFKLDYASSYRAILQGFHSKAYDVCLIDSAMDTGLRLFAQARSLGWTAPMVMIASNNAGEAIRAMRSGIADCLIRDQLSVASVEHSICCVVEQARNIKLMNQRERRYLALLDNASHIVYTHDLKGAFLSINRAGELRMGYSQAEILSMNICQLVAPEYQDLMKNMIVRTLDAQTQTQDEIKLITKYGDHLLVQINTHPINHDGQTVEIQGMGSTRSLWPDKAPWELRRTTEQDHSHIAREDDFAFRTYEVANNFPSQKTSHGSSGSLLTL